MHISPVYPTIPDDYNSEEVANTVLTSDLEQNELVFKQLFHNSFDIVFRKVRQAGENHWLVIYISSLVEEQMVDDHILKPLISVATKLDELTYEKAVDLDDQIISKG